MKSKTARGITNYVTSNFGIIMRVRLGKGFNQVFNRELKTEQNEKEMCMFNLWRYFRLSKS